MADYDECSVAPSSTATPRDSIGSVGPSISSGSSMSNSCSSSSISIKTALHECSAAWLTYLNMLNNLCSAGSKLAYTIAILEQYGNNNADKCVRPFGDKAATQSHPPYLSNSWNDLARATAVATSTVKSHIMAILQDFVTISSVDQPINVGEVEQKRIREHNEQIILENAQTLINIQHQFCAASCDAFLSLTCCFVCQSPVGYPHEQECTMIKSRLNVDQRSQTPSPHFGMSNKVESSRGSSVCDQKNHTYSCLSGLLLDPSGVLSLERETNSSGAISVVTDQQRGVSPQHNIRDIIPLQSIFENTRGPLPNPGQLLSMKIPFSRSVKSPLNFPLFPIRGQRRWSEAAAGEVIDDNLTDTDNQMRRWSMPWEATKTDQNTVTWSQTRIMPMNTCKYQHQKTFAHDCSNSVTPDPNWQSSITSQDGLTEAIQLLSCKPAKSNSTSVQQNNSLQPSDTVGDEAPPLCR